MKESVIKDIFTGAKGNIETMALTKTNKDNLKEVADYYDKLKKRFNVKQMKVIDRFLGIYDKNNYDEINFYFTQGFKLGLRIAVECFEDN